MNAARLMALATACVLFATPVSTWSGEAPDHVPGRVVVKLAPGEAAAAATGQPPAFLEAHGALSIRPALRQGRRPLLALERRFGLDRIFVIEISREADVEAISRVIASHPGAEYAHADYIGQGGAVPVVADDTSFSVQWNLDNTGQSGGTPDADMDVAEAWYTATGRRETLVAVLDSGIDGDHSQFRGRIARGGFDEVNSDRDPEDDHSHGTYVGGITLAIANDEFSVAGIDWRAMQLPIKVLNSSNSGTTTDLMNGITYAANVGADVSNMSLINYPATGGLANAVAFADTAGVIQIGCNGNGGSSTLSYPASFPEVLATGWTDRNDVRSASSNFTTTLDVVAPGVSVRTVPYNSGANSSTSFSGCSAATPNAAGVASVLLALDPTLTYTQVRDILRSTADDEVGPSSEDVPGRDDYFGWGRVNMERALGSLGLVSEDVIHVDGIVMKEASGNSLSIRVAVVDDLTGAEDAVQVDGTLTLPDLSTVPLSGTTGSNGVAELAYQPGGPLPSGTFTFAVDDLTKAGFVYDASANFETTRSHDPDLDGLHVGAIEFEDDFETLSIDVLVLDDDEVPEGGVTVDAQLTPPSGPAVNFSGQAEWAAGGWVRFEHSPVFGRDPGLYTFDVTSVSKSGFTYESARNVESSDTVTALDATADEDGDSVSNELDNCVSIPNGPQTDFDGDGFGDACDTCGTRSDPAQVDADADGTGDRCDCSPYDASTTDVGTVRGVSFAGDKVTLSWFGVAGADTYDISRGDLASLDGISYGSCLSDDQTERTLVDAVTPAAGSGFFYVLRGDDAICGPGSMGDKSDGQERTNGDPFACGP